jgi:hypothetical protein
VKWPPACEDVSPREEELEGVSKQRSEDRD